MFICCCDMTVGTFMFSFFGCMFILKWVSKIILSMIDVCCIDNTTFVLLTPGLLTTLFNWRNWGSDPCLCPCLPESASLCEETEGIVNRKHMGLLQRSPSPKGPFGQLKLYSLSSDTRIKLSGSCTKSKHTYPHPIY